MPLAESDLVTCEDWKELIIGTSKTHMIGASRMQTSMQVRVAAQNLLFAVVLATATLLSGCASKAEKITSLVNEQRYAEAHSIVQTLSEKERQSPEVQEAVEDLAFHSARARVPKLDATLGFVKTDSVLDSVECSIRSNSIYRDSLIQLRKSNAFNGARDLAAKGEVGQAYALIVSYVSLTLSASENSLADTLRMKWLTGWWVGHLKDENGRPVMMYLQAITPSVFSGQLYLTPSPGMSHPLIDGTFDGHTLTTSYQSRWLSVDGYHECVYNLIGHYEQGQIRVDNLCLFSKKQGWPQVYKILKAFYGDEL
jgi:outer membrane murein-binding lipoprotein Lpp